MEGLIEEVKEATEEVFGKEFIVRADGNKFQMIVKDYYDEMVKSTNTIDVVLKEDAHMAIIIYRIENVADMKWNIRCSNKV